MKLFLACMTIILSGCVSSPRMSASERSLITHVVVVESYSNTNPKLSPFLSESGVSGALGGAASGFVVGLFNPYSWFVGGPILTTPLLATVQAKCGSAFSKVEEPKKKLHDISEAIEISAFRKSLESSLTRELESRLKKIVLKSTLLLEIYNLEIEIESSPSAVKDDWSCYPSLSAKATWRVRANSNTPILEEKITYCGLKSSLTFKEWFNDTEGRAKDITQTLECLGSKVVNQLLTGSRVP